MDAEKVKPAAGLDTADGLRVLQTGEVESSPNHSAAGAGMEAGQTGDNRLPALAAEIGVEHAAAAKAGVEFVKHAIEAGRRLNEAKALVAHGSWRDWLEAHVPGLSIRTSQRYMRAADRAKNDTVSFSSLRDMIAPRRREERFLPLAHHLRVGVRQDETSTEEIWIARSFQHRGFYYVSRIKTAVGGSEIVGGRRPIRADYVNAMVAAMASNAFDQFSWQDIPFAADAWTHNVLLFDTPEEYLDSLGADDVHELSELASGQIREGISAHVRQRLSGGECSFLERVLRDGESRS